MHGRRRPPLSDFMRNRRAPRYRDGGVSIGHGAPRTGDARLPTAAGFWPSLRAASTPILGHLQDPFSEGSWNRRGLVIGHVQSGKTANYTGVIAKAADAGYKLIIVSAGIHSKPSVSN